MLLLYFLGLNRMYVNFPRSRLFILGFCLASYWALLFYQSELEYNSGPLLTPQADHARSVDKDRPR